GLLTLAGFQDRCFRPLSHPSAGLSEAIASSSDGAHYRENEIGRKCFLKKNVRLIKNKAK
ncbi:hypothetical protein LZS94_14300, partial [Aliivibrio fischeri]|uniref:hypothetical protein n=1 Tax=Aliivibrio fischeri TaxID=668 RepID=UPI001F18829F